MYILLSPSKSLDFTRSHPLNDSGTVAPFIEETQHIHEHLRTLSVSELRELLRISDKLAELNHARYSDWSADFSEHVRDADGAYNFLPALLAFTGDVYKGFNLTAYDASTAEYLQTHLGILSGFHGLLSPLDNIKPYRLEMGTKLNFTVGKTHYHNLYSYWSEKVTAEVGKRAAKTGVVLNLASREYCNVIDRTALTAQMIDVDFRVQNGETRRIIGVYAKRARGQMAHWLLSEKIDTISGAQEFAHDGWHYERELSDDDRITFIKNID